MRIILQPRTISSAVLALVVGLALAGNALNAAERKLTAEEIRLSPTGNTIEGIWRGTPYRSYFAADGAPTRRKDNIVPNGARSVGIATISIQMGRALSFGLCLETDIARLRS